MGADVYHPRVSAWLRITDLGAERKNGDNMFAEKRLSYTREARAKLRVPHLLEHAIVL